MARTKYEPKRKGSKFSLRCLFILPATALFVAGIITTFIVIGFISSCLVEAFDFSPEDYQIARTSTIYYVDENGKSVVYENINSPSNRRWVKIDKIPKEMKDALVAIEDERFYSHHGVDYKRTAGAILGFVSGNDSYGGSTITQQVVKNITKDNERDAMRKVREIFRAVKLESEYSKDEILEFYLNVAHFGVGNGVQAASHAYFGKEPIDLNLAECACIVGITQYPSKYNPLKDPEANKKRQETVLKKMYELGMIDKNKYKEALEYELVFSTGTQTTDDPSSQSYFTELVIDQVVKDLVEKGGYSQSLAESTVYNGGLTIYTTIDPKIQTILENSMLDMTKYTTDPELQAAVVVMDPYTGQIKGLVGGAGEKNGDLVLNRAVDTYRQPGSTMKPVAVYGPAMELGLIYSPSSPIVDKKVYFEDVKWEPKNYYNGYKGATTIRRAVELSMNTPAAQLAHEMGYEEGLSYLRDKYHISSLKPSDQLAAVSLGGMTKGVNLIEWTAAYCTFPNGGEWIKPVCYTKVVDHRGKVILSNKQKTEYVFSPETTFLMTDILRTTATSMLGNIPGMSCAGKTGTSNDTKDKWYMGFTPYYVAGVWVGHDNATALNDYATMNSPQKIWKAVMTDIHADLDDIGFGAAPEGIKKVRLCASTGKLATSACPSIYDYANTNMIKYCSGRHALPKVEEPPKSKEETPEEEAPTEETETEEESTPTSPAEDDTPTESVPSDTPTTPSTPPTPSVPDMPEQPESDSSPVMDAVYTPPVV